MFGQSSITFTLLLSPVFAAPSFPPPNRGAAVGCSTSSDILSVPSGQSVLVVPSGAPSFIGLGVGVQNYTCSSAGTFTTAGALAELFDLSCVYTKPIFNNITGLAFNKWSAAPASLTAADVITDLIGNPYVLGQHFFQTNAAGGFSPVWDFRSASQVGHPNAFVVGAKTGDLPSPNGASNVDWLQLKNSSGLLADEIFRTNTISGQPPSSCTVGSGAISVKYTALYTLYGNSS